MLPSLEWTKALERGLGWEYFKWSCLQTTLCRCGTVLFFELYIFWPFFYLPSEANCHFRMFRETNLDQSNEVFVYTRNK